MSKKIIFTAAIAGLLLPYPLAAQNNNILIVEQRGSENTLSVDQSQATNSLVAGVQNFTNDDNLVVSGDVSGDGEEIDDENLTVTLNSAGSAMQDGVANTGTVILAGDGSFAGLEQLGDGNSASINVNGADAGGIIVQSGNGNDGTIEVTSNGAFGELIQIGDENNAGFTVSGSPNANVSLTIEGDRTEPSLPVNVVTSNGGQITIVQRQLGSFE